MKKAWKRISAETRWLIMVCGLMWSVQLGSLLFGTSGINPEHGITATFITFIVYLLIVVLRTTSQNVIADSIWPSAGQSPEHQFGTTPAVALTDHFPQPLLEHQEAVRSFYSFRTTGKSQLVHAYLLAMKHQHLTLVLDEGDLQNMTRQRAEELGTGQVRILTAAKYRNVLLGTHHAYHFVVATNDFPDMLRGIVFEDIEVSPMLAGREPEWVPLIKTVNQGKLDGVICSYPRCSCPADHPGTKNWCLRGLPTGERFDVCKTIRD